jgi:hypothetical protein
VGLLRGYLLSPKLSGPASLALFDFVGIEKKGATKLASVESRLWRSRGCQRIKDVRGIGSASI